MDVLTDLLQVGFIADDMLIVIALPEGLTGGVLHCVDPAGGYGFEILQDGAKRPALRTVW